MKASPRSSLSAFAASLLPLVAVLIASPATTTCDAFGMSGVPRAPPPRTFRTFGAITILPMAADSSEGATEDRLTTITDSDAIAVPFPFISPDAPTGGVESKIMCHVDCIATISGIDYSVGYPCDHAVDIAYVAPTGSEGSEEDEEEGLVLIEVEDPLMDALFPICKAIVEEDNKEAKLALYRTPATLTLAGNLGIDDDEDDGGEAEEEDDEEGAADLLLTFEHEGKEYNLVRPTDLMLLVAKPDPSGNAEQKVLIDDEESEVIMPALMEMLGL